MSKWKLFKSEISLWNSFQQVILQIKLNLKLNLKYLVECYDLSGFFRNYEKKKKHCVKSVQKRSYFWSVFSCIQPKYKKIRTRNNSVIEHFSRNVKEFIYVLNKKLPTIKFTAEWSKRWINIIFLDVQFL